jgi:hypothetical protein
MDTGIPEWYPTHPVIGPFQSAGTQYTSFAVLKGRAKMMEER